MLGPELRVVDSRHAYVRALELGVRLGAQFVTARAAAGPDRRPGRAVRGCSPSWPARYQLRPLITVVPGTPVATLEPGARGDRRHRRRHRARRLTAHPDRRRGRRAGGRARAGDLGYVRVPAAELADGGPPGLLATLPPQVAVAIGGSP